VGLRGIEKMGEKMMGKVEVFALSLGLLLVICEGISDKETLHLVLLATFCSILLYLRLFYVPRYSRR
jgi:hypothetical protein